MCICPVNATHATATWLKTMWYCCQKFNPQY